MTQRRTDVQTVQFPAHLCPFLRAELEGHSSLLVPLLAAWGGEEASGCGAADKRSTHTEAR